MQPAPWFDLSIVSAVAAVLSAVFTALYYHATVQLLRAARESLAVSQRLADAGLRPFVAITSVSSDSNRLVTAVVENFGGGAAIGVRADFTCNLDGKRHVEPVDGDSWSLTIHPKGKAELRASLAHFEAEASFAGEGAVKLAELVVELSYKDIGGGNHHYTCQCRYEPGTNCYTILKSKAK